MSLFKTLIPIEQAYFKGSSYCAMAMENSILLNEALKQSAVLVVNEDSYCLTLNEKPCNIQGPRELT